VRILRLQNKPVESKKGSKRQVQVLKEELVPTLNLALTEALDAHAYGDHIYFLFPGVIIKYNITYNIFDEIVKTGENIQKL